MNNHHDIVYVECPVQESEDWYAKRGLDSIRTPVKPLKDVFVFTKEELMDVMINFANQSSISNVQEWLDKFYPSKK